MATTERREKSQEWVKVMKSSRGSGGNKTVVPGEQFLSPLTLTWCRKRPVRRGRKVGGYSFG